jgi:hypothetical protein
MITVWIFLMAIMGSGALGSAMLVEDTRLVNSLLIFAGWMFVQVSIVLALSEGYI